MSEQIPSREISAKKPRESSELIREAKNGLNKLADNLARDIVRPLGNMNPKAALLEKLSQFNKASMGALLKENIGETDFNEKELDDLVKIFNEGGIPKDYFLTLVKTFKENKNLKKYRPEFGEIAILMGGEDKIPGKNTLLSTTLFIFDEKNNHLGDGVTLNLVRKYMGDGIKLAKILNDQNEESKKFFLNYLKDHDIKEILKIRDTFLHLPTPKEMEDKGSTLLKMTEQCVSINLYTAEGNPRIPTERDFEIFDNFGWASNEFFNLPKEEQDKFILAAQTPEGKKAQVNLGKMYENIRSSYSKSLGEQANMNELKKYFKLYLSGSAGGASKDEMEIINRLRNIVNNYDKYPKIIDSISLSLPMLNEEYGNTDKKSQPLENFNEKLGFISDILTKSSPQLAKIVDSQKTTDVLQFLIDKAFTNLKDESSGKARNFDTKQYEKFLSGILSSPEKVEAIYNNQKFLDGFFTAYKINVVSFLENFPLNLLNDCQPQLLELAKKYPFPLLRELLNFRIKSREDLDCLIRNDISVFFVAQLRDGDTPDLRWLPANIFLENDLAKILKYSIPNPGFHAVPSHEFIQQYGDYFFPILDNCADPYSPKVLLKEMHESEKYFTENFEKIKAVLSANINSGSDAKILINIAQKRPSEEKFKKIFEVLKIFGNGKVELWPILRRLNDSVEEDLGTTKKIIELLYKSNQLSSKNDFFIEILDRATGRCDTADKKITEPYRSKFLDLIESNSQDIPGLIAIFNSKSGTDNKQNLLSATSHYNWMKKKCPEVLKYEEATRFFLNMASKGVDHYTSSLIDRLNEFCKTDGNIVRFLEDNLFIDSHSKADLQNFDISKPGEYKRVFSIVDAAGYKGFSLMKKFLENHDNFNKFKQDIAKMDIIEVELAIDNFCKIAGGYYHASLIVIAMEETRNGLGSLFAEGKTDKIEVTEASIGKISALFRIYSEFPGTISTKDSKIVDSIRIVFPEFQSTGNPKDDLHWLISKIDLAKIIPKGFDNNINKISELARLMYNLSEIGDHVSAECLEKQIKQIDISKITFESTGYSILELNKVEEIRKTLNIGDRVSGDKMIEKIGSDYLERNRCSYKNIKELLRFADTWNSTSFDRDVNGIYQSYASYAYAEIGTFLKREIETARKNGNEDEIIEKLRQSGVDYSKTAKNLEQIGVFNITESNLKKLWNNIKEGKFRYIFRKAEGKVFGDKELTIDIGNIRIERNDWAERKGVEVLSIKEGNEELAKVIKCDPAAMNVKILIEPDGKVDMQKEAAAQGRKLVFSAPLTFSTGDRKMTELAFRDGQQMNYLLSANSKDGFLLVDQNGRQKMLNKKDMKISDLLDNNDLSKPEIAALLNGLTLDQKIEPTSKIGDKNLFFKILKAKKHSLLGGMLLLDTKMGISAKIEDGSDSRRLYLEFKDGKFGIINSTNGMTTAKAVALAKHMGAVKAMYMDTGMYDKASYRDGNGGDHELGHKDTDESTNRVVIYEK